MARQSDRTMLRGAPDSVASLVVGKGKGGGQPMNMETSQPMSLRRSLQVSTYWLLQMHGRNTRTRMKPGSMMNLVRGGLRGRGER